MLLTQVFIQRQLANTHVVHPTSPLWEAGVFQGCLVLSSQEASLGGGLGNVLPSEGIQPIFCRVFVVEAGSCSGCTKEKGSCCNKAMLCLGRTLAAAAEKVEGRCWDVGEVIKTTFGPWVACVSGLSKYGKELVWVLFYLYFFPDSRVLGFEVSYDPISQGATVWTVTSGIDPWQKYDGRARCGFMCVEEQQHSLALFSAWGWWCPLRWVKGLPAASCPCTSSHRSCLPLQSL